MNDGNLAETALKYRRRGRRRTHADTQHIAGDQMTITERSVVNPPYVGSEGMNWRRLVRRLIVPSVIVFCLFLGLAFGLLGPIFPLPFAIPVAVLALLAIWALPDMQAGPTSVLRSLFWAFLVVMIAWPNYLAIDLPGLPWITVMRLVDVPLIAALLICLSVGPDFRGDLRAILSATPGVSKLLIAFTILAFLSIALSKQPLFSAQKFVIALTSWTAIYFTACYVFAKPKRVEIWAATLWMLGVFVSLIGLWEHRLGHVPWVGHIPSFLKMNDPDVERILAGTKRDALDLYRVQSTATTSVGLAEYLALTIPFVLRFAAGPFRWFVRCAAAASIPLFLVVILETTSRLGVIGLILALGLYLLAWGAIEWRNNPRSLFGPAITLGYPVIGCVVLAATFFIGHLHAVVWGNGYQAASNQSRVDQIRMGLPMVLHRPWGYGIGRAAETVGYTNSEGFLTLDTYWLSIALEYGVIGFIIYYGMFVLAIWDAGRTALRAPRSDREAGFLVPAAISLCIFIVGKSTFSQQDNHPVVFMILGMVAALKFRVDREAKVLAASQEAAQRGAPRRIVRPAHQPARL